MLQYKPLDFSVVVSAFASGDGIVAEGGVALDACLISVVESTFVGAC